MLKTLIFIGVILGGIVFGILADWLGADIVTSFAVSTIGSFVGIWAGYKVSTMLG
jgi:hypothetical protein